MNEMYLDDWRGNELLSLKSNEEESNELVSSTTASSEWSCFGVNRHDSHVCNSKGLCVSQDFCVCEDGTTFGNCTKLNQGVEEPSVYCDWNGNDFPECGFQTIDPLIDIDPKALFNLDEKRLVCEVTSLLMDERCEFEWYLKEKDFERHNSYGYEPGRYKYYESNVIANKLTCYLCKIGLGSIFNRGSLIFGGNSFAILEDKEAVKVLCNNFSLKFWFKSESLLNSGKTLFHFVTSSNWKIFIDENRKLSIEYPFGRLSLEQNIADNKIYGIYITKSSTSGLFIYLGGELAYSDSDLVEEWCQEEFSTKGMDTIGSNSDGSRKFTGEIEYFDITTRPLSFKEIKSQDLSEDWTCFNVSHWKDSVCSGNGICEHTDLCTCFVGYHGVDCGSITNNETIVNISNHFCSCNDTGLTVCSQYEPYVEYRVHYHNQKLFLNRSVSLPFCHVNLSRTDKIKITNHLFLNSGYSELEFVRYSKSPNGTLIYLWIDLSKTYNSLTNYPNLFSYNVITGEVRSFTGGHGFPDSFVIGNSNPVSIDFDYPQLPHTVINVVFLILEGSTVYSKALKSFQINETQIRLKVTHTNIEENNVEFLVAVDDNSAVLYRFISIIANLKTFDIIVNWFSIPKGGYSTFVFEPLTGKKLFVKVENETSIFSIESTGPSLIFNISHPTINQHPSNIFIKGDEIVISTDSPSSTFIIKMEDTDNFSNITYSTIISNDPLYPSVPSLKELVDYGQLIASPTNNTLKSSELDIYVHYLFTPNSSELFLFVKVSNVYERIVKIVNIRISIELLIQYHSVENVIFYLTSVTRINRKYIIYIDRRLLLSDTSVLVLEYPFTNPAETLKIDTPPLLNPPNVNIFPFSNYTILTSHPYIFTFNHPSGILIGSDILEKNKSMNEKAFIVENLDGDGVLIDVVSHSYPEIIIQTLDFPSNITSKFVLKIEEIPIDFHLKRVVDTIFVYVFTEKETRIYLISQSSIFNRLNTEPIVIITDFYKSDLHQLSFYEGEHSLLVINRSIFKALRVVKKNDDEIDFQVISLIGSLPVDVELMARVNCSNCGYVNESFSPISMNKTTAYPDLNNSSTNSSTESLIENPVSSNSSLSPLNNQTYTTNKNMTFGNESIIEESKLSNITFLNITNDLNSSIYLNKTIMNNGTIEILNQTIYEIMNETNSPSVNYTSSSTCSPNVTNNYTIPQSNNSTNNYTIPQSTNETNTSFELTKNNSTQNYTFHESNNTSDELAMNNSTQNNTLEGNGNLNGTHNDSINVECFGISWFSNLTCSSCGICVGNDICACNDGYSGRNCHIPMCYGLNSTSEIVCNGNGKCQDRDLCICDDGYSGVNCQFKTFIENQCSGSFVKTYAFTIRDQYLVFENRLTDRLCGKHIVNGKLNITLIPMSVIELNSEIEIISNMITTFVMEETRILYVSFQNSLKVNSRKDVLYMVGIDMDLLSLETYILPISNIHDLEKLNVSPRLFGQIKLVTLPNGIYGLTTSPDPGNALAFSIDMDNRIALFLGASDSITTFSLLSKGNPIYTPEINVTKYIFLTITNNASILDLTMGEFTKLPTSLPPSVFSIFIANPDTGKQFWLSFSGDGVNVSRILPNIESEEVQFIHLASDPDFIAKTEEELIVTTTKTYTIVSSYDTGVSLRVENIMLAEVPNILDLSLDKSTSNQYFSISNEISNKLLIDSISTNVLPTYEPTKLIIYGNLDIENTNLMFILKYHDVISTSHVIKIGSGKYQTTIQNIDLNTVQTLDYINVIGQVFIQETVYSSFSFINVPSKIFLFNRIHVVDVIPQVSFYGDFIHIVGSFFPSKTLITHFTLSEPVFSAKVVAEFENTTFALVKVPRMGDEVNVKVNVQIYIPDYNVLTEFNEKSVLWYVDPQLTKGVYSLNQFSSENSYNISNAIGKPLITMIPSKSSPSKSSILFKLNQNNCYQTNDNIRQTISSKTIYDLLNKTIIDFKIIDMGNAKTTNVLEAWFTKNDHYIQISLQFQQPSQTRLIIKLSDIEEKQVDCNFQENIPQQLQILVVNNVLQVKVYDIDLALTICSISTHYPFQNQHLRYALSLGQSTHCKEFNSSLLALEVITSYQKCVFCSQYASPQLYSPTENNSLISGLSIGIVVIVFVCFCCILLSITFGCVYRRRRLRMKSAKFVYYDKSNQRFDETMADLFKMIGESESSDNSEKTDSLLEIIDIENHSNSQSFNEWV